MKVVLFGRSKHRTQTNLYFQNAFEKLGHSCRWINYRKIRSLTGKSLATWGLKKYLSWTKPDFLFLYMNDISLDLLDWAKDRMTAVMYYEDPLWEGNDRFEQMVRFASHTRRLYLTSRGDIPEYEDQGISATYLPGGCDPEAHQPAKDPDSTYGSDVAFIGRPNNQQRVEWLREIDRDFDLKIWGSGWEEEGLKSWKENVYPEQYRQICTASKIVLGQNAVVKDMFFSNRIWYTMGCKGFFLTQYTPNMEEIFERATHLDWFENIKEGKEKIDYYLSHPQEREKIAQAGYELVHKDYSFEKVLERMFEDLKNEGILE